MTQPEADPQLAPARLYDYGDDDPFTFPDAEGERFRTKATLYAVTGIFLFGVVFGPLAIMNAGKAEERGVQAPFGKICGWIVLVLNGLGIFYAMVSLALVGN